ncbi:MAG: DUF3343 domain-containing protein [Oscillospiraceae bacterium]
MLEKSLKCIVTFHTTVGAMAMEKICRDTGVAGRLIPVPRVITAGCGMCWMAPPEARPAVERAAADLDVDGVYELLI